MRGVTILLVFTSTAKSFQLTRLMRGVTVKNSVVHRLTKFQLTRLMRGVTWRRFLNMGFCGISTHTPHARRDRVINFLFFTLVISTHTPHARRDWSAAFASAAISNFNSHASCEA